MPGVREAVTGELDVEAVLRRRDALVNDLHDDHQVPWREWSPWASTPRRER